MIKKTIFFFFALILSANLSAQDCSIDLSLGVILGNSQSYCAPFELTLIVDAPENPPETEWGGQYGRNFHPLHVYSESGNYPVSLTVTTNLYGCYKEVTYLVSVEPNFHLYIPNTFTPNNDGVNDGFKPIISGHDYFEFFIFDKWGGRFSIQKIVMIYGMEIMKEKNAQ